MTEPATTPAAATDLRYCPVCRCEQPCRKTTVRLISKEWITVSCRVCGVLVTCYPGYRPVKKERK